MLKVLILQATNGMRDEATEYFMRDRLTWKRFLGLEIADAVPDANTIWTFREHLTKASAIKGLFDRFDRALREAGYLACNAGKVAPRSSTSSPTRRGRWLPSAVPSARPGPRPRSV